MSYTILVAEDDPQNRKLFRDILALRDYTVLEAENGREAVELARKHAPDLLLLDIQMPVLDGFEVVKILKQDAATASIPVWALTSYAMPGDDAKIRQAGCDEHVTKPVDVSDFLHRVDTYFRDKNSE